MDTRRQIVNSLRIAQALTSDYIGIYYVNLENERFIEYRSTDEYQELGIEVEGEDFFSVSRKNALRVIYPEDRELFIAMLTKENMVRMARENRTVRLTYRMLFENGPEYVQLKAAAVEGDSSHIVIGVVNVNEYILAQQALKQVKEERVAYARIFALSGDYICLYTVDPETGRYTEYSATQTFRGLGFDAVGEDFFINARRDSR